MVRTFFKFVMNLNDKSLRVFHVHCSGDKLVFVVLWSLFFALYFGYFLVILIYFVAVVSHAVIVSLSW